MANQTIGVTLQFNADINAARRDIRELQQNLLNLSKNINLDSLGKNFNAQFLEAKKSAGELFTILQKSTNVKTGLLDLRSFTAGLKNSNKTLTDYGRQLSLLGEDGDKAFRQVANSVVQAEVPLTKTSKLAASLWDTLKRTAKWQLSSSIIHGLMGGIQQAYHYAEDLNESLNNIRIVTGQSVDEMARFAKEANRSAQALGSTTTAYTDAALIYYQQGLSDQEVKERTDVTMKMANVTRESAETVSQQMTAVWNNFAKGGEALESYADKMTALGAATASSSAEISQGLEKFAGVADTIGLSFDYAAAALTTITATTRMSADTVGTALKTLFSRLESLQLGETLEDGTDLTKYSAALATVGVNIKDSNGELKQMDQILDETMAKWKTLSKDQQVALAQTVAGQRQYTQFVTLMENSDFFKKNLETEADAMGTLQQQQDIYVESWEAASKKVQAALESIFEKIIDDDFFIDLLHNAESVVKAIDKIIDVAGGLKGVLAIIGSLVTQIFSREISSNINNMVTRFQDLSGITGAEMNKQRQEALSNLKAMSVGTGMGGEAQQIHYNFQEKALRLAEKMNDYDKERVKSQSEHNQLLIELINNLEEEQQKQEQISNSLVKQANEYKKIKENQEIDYAGIGRTLAAGDEELLKQSKNQNFQWDSSKIANAWGIDEQNTEQWVGLADYIRSDVTLPESMNGASQELDTLIEKYQQLKSAGGDNAEVFETIRQRIQEILVSLGNENKPTIFNPEELSKAEQQLQATGKLLGVINVQKQNISKDGLINEKNLSKATDELKDFVEELGKTGQDTHEIENLVDQFEKEAKATDDASKKLELYLKLLEDIENKTQGFKNQQSQDAMNNGKSQEDTNNLFESAFKEGQASEGAREALGDMSTQNEEFEQSLKGVQSGIGEAVTAFSNYAMTIQMVSAQMETLISSWGDGKVELQDFTALLNLSISGLRLFSQISDVANKVEAARKKIIELNNKASADNLILQGANKNAMLGGLIVKKADTTGWTLNTAAIKANAAAIKMHPILIILTIIPLIISGISAITNKIKENNAQLKENAEKTQQAAQASREELDSISEQKNAYDDVYKKWQDGKATKEELNEVSLKLADTLGLENASILIEQQRYADLNKEIDETIKKKAIIAEQDARDALEANQKNAKRQLFADEGWIEDKSVYSALSAINLGRTYNADINEKEIAKRLEDFILKNNFQAIKDVEEVDKGFLSKINTKLDPQSLNNTSEELQKMLWEIDSLSSELGQNDNLTLYRQEIVKDKNKIDEYLRSLSVDAQNIETILDSQQIQGTLKISFNDLNISTYNDKVNEIAQNILDQGLTDSEELAKAAAENFIVKQSSDFSNIANRAKLINDMIGENADEAVRKAVEESVANLDESTLAAIIALEPKFEIKNGKFYIDGEEYDSFEAWLNAKQQEIENKAKSNSFNALVEVDTKTTWEQGKNYKAKDVKALQTGFEATKIDFNQYFTQMADGTYQLTAGLASFNEALETAKIETYTVKINELFEKFGTDGANTAEEIKELADAQWDLANSAENLTELQSYLNQGLIDDAIYSEKATQIRDTFMAQAVDPQELQDYTNYLVANEEQFEGNIKAAEAYARATLRMNKGVETLAKNIDDWTDILNNSTKGSKEYVDALSGMQKAVADLLDVMPEDLNELLNADNAAENLELLKEAANGSEEAIDALKAKMQELGAQSLIEAGLKIDTENLEQGKTALEQLFLQFKGLKAEMENPLDMAIDDSGFIQALQNMLDQGLITQEGLNQMLGNMQLEAQYEQETVDNGGKISKPKIVQEWVKSGEAKEEYTEGGQTFTSTRPNWTLKTTAEMEEFDVPSEATAFSLATSDLHGNMKNPPKITGISKKPSGSANNYSSVNKGGGSPSGKGGGGGGGGGSEKKTKKASDEIERYHEINEQLDDMSRKLDQIGTAKNRAFGAKHIAAIDAEIAALEEESKLLDEKFKETKEYFDQDAAALNAYGAIYDSAGRITNYNKIIEDSVAKYNAGTIDDEEYDHIKDALSKYEETLNQMEDLTEERAENARKILDAQFEKVEYSIEIKLKINDETNKILDWQMSQLEDQKFASVERINLFDQQVAAANARWMSYMGGINDILKAAGATQEQIEQYLSGDVEAIANLDNLTQQAIDDLGEYVDGLREEQLKLLELQRSIYEELNNLQDEYNNKFENMLSNYEDASTELEFLQNAIDTMGKETAGISNDLLSSLRRGQIEIQYGNIKSLQSQLAMNEAFLKDTQEKLKTATDNERAQLEEMEQTLLDKVSDIKGNIYSEANELMKGLKEDFEANVDAMFEEFEKELSGAFDSFEELRDQFDQARTLREEYIPEYQKLYELAKLTRQINNDIDNTDSVKNKEKLKELQEEITALQADGVELSEYDLKNMQNKYDLRLAEIALEEAQKAKNTVRLTRDSMGNYNYVYTANERNIDEAEQKYEDALYKMQDENEQYLTELSDLYLQIQTEMNEKLIEAAKSGKTNEELNMIKDYYAQRLEYVNSQMNNALSNNTDLYNNDLQAYRNSLRGKIIENKAFTKDFKSTLLGGVLDTYSTLDQYNQDLLGKLGDPTSGTGMLGKISASIAELNTSYETILSQVTGSTVKLGETIGTVYDANGQVITSFADLTKNSLTDVLEETQSTIDKTKEFGEEAKIGYQKAANEVSKASNEIIQKLNQMTAETVKAQLAHELLLKTLERKIVDPNNVVTTTQVNITKNVTSFESTGSSGGSSGGGGGTYSGSSPNTVSNNNSLNPLATVQQTGSKLGQQFGQVLETYDSMNLATWNREMADVKRDTELKVQNRWFYDSNNHYRKYENGQEVPYTRAPHTFVVSGDSTVVRLKCSVCDHIFKSYSYPSGLDDAKKHGAFFKRGNIIDFVRADTSQQALNIVSNKPGAELLKTFNSGGYTGAWGSEGKLAMLHEKELVLNKQDTQNMLATVDFVRSLSSMIDLQGLAQSFGQLATLPQVANNLSNSNSNVSQEIHIDASFPGVTAREEIEQAFSDLALQASQYINR